MSEDPELDQQVDQLVTSLLREYLVRRCFFDVLRLFDFETGARDACLTTPALVTSLRLSRLYKRNAASAAPLPSVLDVLTAYLYRNGAVPVAEGEGRGTGNKVAPRMPQLAPPPPPPVVATPVNLAPPAPPPITSVAAPSGGGGFWSRLSQGPATAAVVTPPSALPSAAPAVAALPLVPTAATIVHSSISTPPAPHMPLKASAVRGSLSYTDEEDEEEDEEEEEEKEGTVALNVASGGAATTAALAVIAAAAAPPTVPTTRVTPLLAAPLLPSLHPTPSAAVVAPAIKPAPPPAAAAMAVPAAVPSVPAPSAPAASSGGGFWARMSAASAAPTVPVAPAAPTALPPSAPPALPAAPTTSMPPAAPAAPPAKIGGGGFFASLAASKESGGAPPVATAPSPAPTSSIPLPATTFAFVAPDGTGFNDRGAYRKYLFETQYAYRGKRGEEQATGVRGGAHGAAPLTKAPGEIDGQPFAIEDCSDVTIRLCDWSEAVTIDRAVRCRILVAASCESLFVRDCVDCTFTLGCKQLRTRDCVDCTVYLYAKTDPIIEASHGMVFARYNAHIPLLPRAFASAALDATRNHWCRVFDFSADVGVGRNWALQDASLREEWVIDDLPHDTHGGAKPINPVTDAATVPMGAVEGDACATGGEGVTLPPSGGGGSGSGLLAFDIRSTSQAAAEAALAAASGGKAPPTAPSVPSAPPPRTAAPPVASTAPDAGGFFSRLAKRG